MTEYSLTVSALSPLTSMSTKIFILISLFHLIPSQVEDPLIALMLDINNLLLKCLGCGLWPPLFVNLFNNACKKNVHLHWEINRANIYSSFVFTVPFPSLPCLTDMSYPPFIISHIPLTILLPVCHCPIHCLSWRQHLTILCLTQSSPGVTWQDMQQSWSVVLKMHDYHIGRVGLGCTHQIPACISIQLTSPLLKTNAILTLNLSPPSLNIFHTRLCIFCPTPLPQISLLIFLQL